jgi:hypothetical protein
MTVVMPDGRRPLPRTAVGRPEIVHTPGMTDDLMREIAPVLAEDGIDLNDPGSIPDMSVLQRALDRAIERRNMALFATIRAGRWSAAGRPSTAPRTTTPHSTSTGQESMCIAQSSACPNVPEADPLLARSVVALRAGGPSTASGLAWRE